MRRGALAAVALLALAGPALAAVALLALAGPALAHDDHGVAAHLAPPLDAPVGARNEYLGHFLHGRIHHGGAHHGDGHATAETLYPARARLSAQPKGFSVLVAPNLVNRAEARRLADPLAIAHCAALGATTVRYTHVERHAPQQMDAWLLQGDCR